MKFKFAMVAAAAMSLVGTTASAVDWGGYVRVGPGQKENAGINQRCFNGGAQGGKGGIGRLGNECETYGEFALSQTMQAGGVNYKALLMSNFYNGGSEPGGTALKVQQIYVEGKGYDVAPNQTFWIGKRFYGRADVHMDDAFFVDMSGTGAGVDGIPLGGAMLNVSVFRTNDEIIAPAVTSNAGTRLNLDLGGIASNPGGTLRLTGVYSDFSGAGGQDGYGLSAQHIQTGVFGGVNTLWAQVSQGSAYLNMGFGGATDGSSVKRWRIVDSVAWLNGPLTAQTLIQYGEEKRPVVGTDKFWSVGGRAAYAMTKNFKLQAELGHAQNKLGSNTARNVTKFTIAPTLTVGPNYYDRPELRFYVSTFRFNDAYRIANGQTKSSKTAAGFQAEIWF